ncbi:MAG: lysoplasmalogenase family protein, partial [Chitinophagaceae bacterium]|nr:lysoplasmalogenase family protein [Chitinophagaceae bacterium]
MPAQQQRLLSLLFALLLAADLLAIAVSWPLLHAITKSLLMPVLMLQLWLANRQAENREWTWVLAGLFFSWLGDMLLLRGGESL